MNYVNVFAYGTAQVCRSSTPKLLFLASNLNVRILHLYFGGFLLQNMVQRLFQVIKNFQASSNFCSKILYDLDTFEVYSVFFNQLLFIYLGML